MGVGWGARPGSQRSGKPLPLHTPAPLHTRGTHRPTRHSRAAESRKSVISPRVVEDTNLSHGCYGASPLRLQHAKPSSVLLQVSVPGGLSHIPILLFPHSGQISPQQESQLTISVFSSYPTGFPMPLSKCCCQALSTGGESQERLQAQTTYRDVGRYSRASRVHLWLVRTVYPNTSSSLQYFSLSPYLAGEGGWKSKRKARVFSTSDPPSLALSLPVVKHCLQGKMLCEFILVRCLRCPSPTRLKAA